MVAAVQGSALELSEACFWREMPEQTDDVIQFSLLIGRDHIKEQLTGPLPYVNIHAFIILKSYRIKLQPLQSIDYVKRFLITAF